MKRLLISVIMLLCLGEIYGQTRLDLSVDAPTGDDRIMSVLTNTATGNRTAAIMQLKAGTGGNEVTSQLVSFHPFYTGTPNTGGYTGLTNSKSGILLNATNVMGKLRFFIGGTNLTNNRMTIADAGVGIGTDTPTANLHMSSGSFFIDNTAKTILQDANGLCWELQVSITGALSTITTTCP